MSIFLMLMKDHWQAFGAILILSFVSIWGETMRIERDSARNSLVKLQTDVKQAEFEQNRKNAQTESNWANTTNKLVTESKTREQEIKSYYEKRIANYRSISAVGLSKCTDQLQASEITQPPSKIDEVPGNCLPIAEQGAECASQVIGWQEWYSGIVKGQVE